MIDHKTYNTLLNAAYDLLGRNSQIPRQFANDFMAAHDYNRGSRNQIERLYQFVTDQTQRRYGGGIIPDDQALFNIVGNYVELVYENWQRAMSSQQGFGGGGGFGGGFSGGFQQQNRGFGNGFSNSGGGFGGGNGFLNSGRPSYVPSSHTDDVIPPAGSAPQRSATASPESPKQAQPVQIFGPLGVGPVTFTHNPLDDYDSATNGRFHTVGGYANWGPTGAKDSSIIILEGQRRKTQDERLQILELSGYIRPYLNKPLAAAELFFDIIPDTLLAENFIFRGFYNHVEVLDVSTEDFTSIRTKFIEHFAQTGQGDNRGGSLAVYESAIAMLDELNAGSSRAISNYLVRHINRDLYLAFRMEKDPANRVAFTAIEDLLELLGPDFQNPLLDVPNARQMVMRLVTNAIVNALTHSSDVMFTKPSDQDLDLIRTSPIFPYAIPGVYPNKGLIPGGSDEDKTLFFEMFEERHLSKKTYIRSLRSVLITNILGEKVLPQIGQAPTIVHNDVAALLNLFALSKFELGRGSESECPKYDEPMYKDRSERYAAYAINPESYLHEEMAELETWTWPKDPVDQTLFAIQYKKNPQDYMLALDILTTMDRKDTENSIILAKKEIKTLTVQG